MILVTGGTGLLGSHLLFDLVNSGGNVRAIKRVSSSIELTRKIFSYYSDESENLLSKIEWVDGDVLDVFSLEEAMKNVEDIYHCAAVVSFNPKEKQNILSVNIDGTTNIVNVALKNNIRKFCHVSSIASLGSVDKNETIDESNFWKTSKQNSAYSVSKYAAEREVWRGIAEGLNAVIVNPSVIVGPGDWSKGSAELFSLMWKGLKFYSNGINGYVDVRDVSKAMILLMKNSVNNERYLLSSENLSYRELFNLIAKYLNKKNPKYRTTPFMGEIAWRFEKIKSLITASSPAITKKTARAANQIFRYSSEKIKKDFDFEFIPMSKSIKETCEKFLKDL